MGQDLLNVVFQHLNLVENAYFGLRYVDASHQPVRTFFFLYFVSRLVLFILLHIYLTNELFMYYNIFHRL